MDLQNLKTLATRKEHCEKIKLKLFLIYCIKLIILFLMTSCKISPLAQWITYVLRIWTVDYSFLVLFERPRVWFWGKAETDNYLT